MARKNESIIVNIQLAAWREQMLTRLLPLTSAIATVGVIVGVISVIERGKEIYIPIYVGAWLLLLLITFIKRLAYKTKAGMLLALIAVMGVTILSETGLSGEGRSFLVVLPIAAMVLLDWQYSLGSMVLIATIFLLFGSLGLPYSQADSGHFIDWLLAATLAAMLATGVVISLRAILENLIATLEKEQKARQQLREVSDHWINKVGQQKRDLERTSTHLAISHEISRLSNNQHGPDRLLQHLSTYLEKEHAPDHISIFMLEPDGGIASLRAAAGDSATRWMSEGRAARSGDDSLVGWCLKRGIGRMISEQDELIPPVLPESRSAMGLPMLVEGKVVGALVLQSKREMAFSEQDMASWQATADQMAIAAGTARQLQITKVGHLLDGGSRIAGAPSFAGRIRETLDIESVIKAAAQEIGETMGLAAVDIKLGTPPRTLAETLMSDRPLLSGLDPDSPEKPDPSASGQRQE